MEADSPLKDLLFSKKISIHPSERYKKFGLSFNPFPRSGISDLNSTDKVVGSLYPIDSGVLASINDFIVDSLFPQNPTSKDKYISAVIRGEYGYGKTQTLLYVKYMLEAFGSEKELNKKPYVVYIDNPGAKLTELIGAIISHIGDENFKRYIWNIVIENIADNHEARQELSAFVTHMPSLFPDGDKDPFSPINTVNYKNFLDGWLKQLSVNPKKSKDFQHLLKRYIISILTTEFENPTVATYFYALLSENIGVNKTWEALTTGNAKDLDKKEVYIIRAIVKLIVSQGFTDFYILVDEFEAVTAGRLTNSEIDRYVTNLRALIDKERNWCSLFAMTGFAFSRLQGVSPPLAERISSRIVELKPLSIDGARQLTINYLNFARSETNEIYPFDEQGIEKLRGLSRGILRVYLKSCFNLLQRATEKLDQGDKIDSAFVELHFAVEEE